MKIVFDFAGVVFHWQPTTMLRRVLPALATDEAAAIHWVEQIFQSWGGDWADFDRGTVEVLPLMRKIAARTGLPEADVQRAVYAIPQELQPDGDTLALMQELREAAHALFYLSNMPAPFADYLLAQHDITRWFIDGVFSARVKLSKPDPAIFELAAERFGARPEDLIFIDDVPANVLAARAAGWQAIQFFDARQCRADLLQLIASGKIGSTA